MCKYLRCLGRWQIKIAWFCSITLALSIQTKPFRPFSIIYFQFIDLTYRPGYSLSRVNILHLSYQHHFMHGVLFFPIVRLLFQSVTWYCCYGTCVIYLVAQFTLKQTYENNIWLLILLINIYLLFEGSE